MKKLLPNASMYVVPKAAHLSNLENPAFFNEKLEAFLKTL
jgi:pimeloyl-ACP methyl ester carboxylesterase